MREYRKSHPTQRSLKGQTDESKRDHRNAVAATSFYDRVHIAVDGEAEDDGTYWLIQAGGYIEGQWHEWVLKRDHERLGLLEVCEWLLGIKQAVERFTGCPVVFVAFSMRYDLDQLVGGDESIPVASKYRLSRQSARNFLPVRGPTDDPYERVGQWRFLLGIKFAEMLKHVQLPDGTLQKRDDGSYVLLGKVTIEDLFTIAPQSFVRCCQSIVLPNVAALFPERAQPLADAMALVESGKQARGQWELAGYDKQAIEQYNLAELQLLATYADILIRLCEQLEVLPRTLAGPAPLARALFRKFAAHKHIQPDNYSSPETQASELLTAQKCAYFGGRIETRAQGMFPVLYEYDLSSAYAAVISQLPCMAHGEWRHVPGKYFLESSGVAMYHIKYHSTIPHWGPFPHRGKRGDVWFPTEGEGWYHRPEVETAQKAGVDIEFLESWVWISTCDIPHPFAFLKDVFAERLKLKQAGNGAEIVIKVAMSSMYGILAQNTGAYRKVDEDGNTIGYHLPSCYNLAAAGHTTSWCRARLFAVMALHPESIVYAATDALYATVPLPLNCPVTKTLGAWEAGEHRDCALVQPGVLFADEGKTKKTRGVSKELRSLSYEAVQHAWGSTTECRDDYVHAHPWRINVELGLYVSLRQCLHTSFGSPVWRESGNHARRCWATFEHANKSIDTSPSALLSKRDLPNDNATPYDFINALAHAADMSTYRYDHPQFRTEPIFMPPRQGEQAASYPHARIFDKLDSLAVTQLDALHEALEMEDRESYLT
jgi:hypothetical protein